MKNTKIEWKTKMYWVREWTKKKQIQGKKTDTDSENRCRHEMVNENPMRIHRYKQHRHASTKMNKRMESRMATKTYRMCKSGRNRAEAVGSIDRFHFNRPNQLKTIRTAMKIRTKRVARRRSTQSDFWLFSFYSGGERLGLISNVSTSLCTW